MKTAARYQLGAQGRSFVPGPNKFGGITGRSPGERPHYGIAGESPACRGKSRQTGPDVNAGFVPEFAETSWRLLIKQLVVEFSFSNKSKTSKLQTLFSLLHWCIHEQ